MTFKTYDINVDLVTDASTTCAIRFSQNDRNSAKLLLTMTNKGAELDLSQAKSVRMSFKKPDGTRVFQNDCQPINALKGKYQILLKTQTLTSVGNVIAQIHIEEEDRTIDSQKFFFVVNESLASDGAIESTNEFPLIQKAIEAGKKLESVDIDGIIAAGAKADGALPKTGGIMEGHLIFTTNKNLSFRNNAGVEKAAIAMDGNDNFFAWNNTGNRYLWKLDPTGKFEVMADNLLSKQGGEVSGTVAYTDIFPQVYKKEGKKSWAVHRPDGNSLIFVPELTPNTSTWDWAKQVELTEYGTVKQANDTNWTDIPLQPNVVNLDGLVTQGRRLGGTVTLALGYRASSLVSDRVMQLPQSFRPDRDLRQHVVTGSGKTVQLLVSSNGIVYCSAVNDDIRSVITYTV